MSELTAAVVSRVLDAFYAKARFDPILGPVFEAIVGDNWSVHMQSINLFWRTALRIDRGYRGKDFMPAHLKHPLINADQLSTWLRLFGDAIDENVPEDIRPAFSRVANAMAENIRIGLSRRTD